MKRQTLLIVIIAALTPACGSAGAAPDGATTAPSDAAPPRAAAVDRIEVPTQFPGLPPVGARASRPHNDGAIILSISPHAGPSRTVYADGRVIGPGDLIAAAENPSQLNSQQWLTRWGVQLLRSRMLAIGGTVGLFTHNLSLLRKAYWRPGLDSPEDDYAVRTGRRLITVGVFSTSYRADPSYRHAREATAAQVQALTQINALITLLPASAWKNRTIRPYIASHYCVAWDRAGPDPAKLTFPASRLLSHLLVSWARRASGTLTTAQAQALYAGFAQAGLRYSSGNWYVPTGKADPRYTDLRFGPRLPDNHC